MNLFQRMSDILSANLNDWAEKFEEPEVMLRQVVREMETAIDQSTEQTAKAMASERLLAQELERNTAQREQWQSRAEKAVQAGDDDLARRAIARKNEYHSLVEGLDDQLKLAQESSRSLQRQLVAMKAKLAEARRNLATLAARKRAADFRKKFDRQALSVATCHDEGAFAKFDRLQAKVERAEAEAEALAQLRCDVTGSATAETDEAAEETSSVTSELNALKRKLGK